MRSIKPLSQKALAVFRVLTEGLTKVGDHRKVQQSREFMPVSVEVVGTRPQGALIVSIAHYYEQNGDLMADPEVTFVVVRDDYVYPITFRQDNLGINREYVRWEGEREYCNLGMQNDLASFGNQWMENIKQQQYCGRLPKSARPSHEPGPPSPSIVDSIVTIPKEAKHDSPRASDV